MLSLKKKMNPKPKIEKAVVAITYDKDDFLILKRKGNWIGWQFCQGRIEEGESEEQAVLRELKEETNLDGEIVKKLDMEYDYRFQSDGENIHKFLTFFLVKVDKEKEVKIDVEHSEWKWVDYETALEMIKFNKDKFEQAYEQLKNL